MLSGTDQVQVAVRELRLGRMVVVADDVDRENEGDLVVTADCIQPAQVAFMLRHGSGIICAPMPPERADELDLALMVARASDPLGTAFTVSVDHRDNSTGISAQDRAMTLRALAHPGTAAADLRRPGHVFPLRSRPGGVLRRAGHTEAATDLARMAGGSGVGVITEILSEEGIPLAGRDLQQFAAEHELALVTVAELIRFRRRSERLVTAHGTARLPTRHGDFVATAYQSVIDGSEHLALTRGDVRDAAASSKGVLVRVHSECVTGDVFGSRRCDCGQQLQDSLRLIAAEGVGVLVYLRGQEGRGIGLGLKMQAYALQEEGRDTVDANLELGLPVDLREYGVGASILSDLGVHRLRLITNSPDKYHGLAGFDLEVVGRVRLSATVRPENIAYLTAKRDRMGHLLDLPDCCEAR
ncbi:MAG TPA: bifunctional 3,4-dihydroxy-2-butanone-4-phosphate synthase/GTP cyclohydrolase II [Solirubrobacteraceae bacterium]|nr:bifunctional 3,4-dihydroxy-2-butanone-4-phosphate synthase/GTP cyclohydrolase II [Solirubrobacteraceae bacterium]